MAAKRWYAVIYGAIINLFVFAMANSCMPVLFKEISDQLDLSVLQVGIVWGAGSVAGIFSIFPAGLLTDRYGAKRVLTVVCILAGITGALRGLSNSFLTLMLTSILFGVFSETVPVITVKNASQRFSGDKHFATIQAVVTACVGIGMMLGAMLSATVLSPLLGGWQHVMYFYGGISALMGLIWLFTVSDHPAPVIQSPKSPPRPAHTIRHVLSNRTMWFIALAMMCFAGSNKGFMGYLPLFLRDSGWTASAADGTLAAFNAASTVIVIPLALLSDKIGLRKAFLLPGILVTFVSMGILSVVTSAPAIWLLAILSGAFRETIWAIAATLTVETDGIGAEYAGTAVGMEHAFTRVGYTFAPPAGNSFVSLGAGMPFAFWAGLSFLTLVFFLFVKETGRKKRLSAVL